MLATSKVSQHYQDIDLLKSIKNGFKKQGKTNTDISIDDLECVDELHIGGRKASEHLLHQFFIAEILRS